MYIREYGTDNDRVLLFFPGSCEPWQDHAYAAEELAENFHVLLVVPDAQDPEEHTDFISVEKTVDDVSDWLGKHGISQLDALYGLSYGGGMATRFMVTTGISVKKAIIDAGTAPYEYPKWICKLLCVRDYLMFKAGRASIELMKAAFPPERFARNPKRVNEEYEEIKKYLKTYSNKTIWNIFWSANNYDVPHPAPRLDTEIQFWLGTEEWGSRFRDLKWYKKYLPQLELVKIPGMMHGEFVMMHPKEFASKAMEFYDRKSVGLMNTSYDNDDAKSKSRNYFNTHRKSKLAHGGYWRHDYKYALSVIDKIAPDRLIDIGCGPGAFLEEVQKHFPDIQLNALDLSEEMIEETKSRLSDTAIVTVGDSENMPLEDEQYGVVTCNMSIHHYPHPQKAVNEMYRILKKGGYLLLNDMDCIPPIRTVANFIFPRMKTGDVKMYKKAEILGFMKKAGFKRVKYRKISPFSFQCVAKK
jgi:ubiquinone/menaquinone biosynthesis C-methylase UbiE/pimeloyl-ACP methyl ester carboxylesterase